MVDYLPYAGWIISGCLMLATLFLKSQINWLESELEHSKARCEYFQAFASRTLEEKRELITAHPESIRLLKPRNISRESLSSAYRRRQDRDL